MWKQLIVIQEKKKVLKDSDKESNHLTRSRHVVLWETDFVIFSTMDVNGRHKTSVYFRHFYQTESDFWCLKIHDFSDRKL